MTLFAATIPLSVLPSILSVKLAVNLRFRELGLIQVVSATARNGLLLFFAWAGFGARSFLLPVLITSVTDALLLWMVTRFSPWTLRPRFRLWPELFADGRWILLGTFSIAIGNNGAYFVLGQLLSSDVVGTYFFAYQLVVQLGVLLSDNVYQVLAPSFMRMGPDLARIRAAVPRALSVVVLVGATASLSIAAIYEPLERALWHGKWSAATNSVHILGVIWPAAAAVSVLRALQMATGHFRQWGIVTFVGAVASIFGAAVGAYIGGTAGAAAMGFGLGVLLGTALNAAFALPRIGVRALDAAHGAWRYQRYAKHDSSDGGAARGESEASRIFELGGIRAGDPGRKESGERDQAVDRSRAGCDCQSPHGSSGHAEADRRAGWWVQAPAVGLAVLRGAGAKGKVQSG